MLNILPKLGIRVLSSVVTILIIISLIFFALQLAPGDASYKYLSSELSSEAIQKISSDFKTDGGIFEKYTAFMSNILQWDFGYSLNHKKDVFDIIKPKLGFTFLFSLVAFSLQLLVSFILAYFSAKNPFGKLDRTLKPITLVSYSTPPFVSGLILIYIFSYTLNIFPISGAYSNNFDELSFWGQLTDVLKHLFLPVLVFALVEIPIYYNYLRESLKNIVSSTFILYLRSIGTKESTLFWKHILPNAINPVIAVASAEIGVLLGGSLVIEVVFGLPGMGRLIVSAIATSDFPLVIGCCFVASSIVILTGFFADVLRILIDKRLARGLSN